MRAARVSIRRRRLLLCQAMDRKMSFSITPGSSKYADAHLVTLDGIVIPFHRIIFDIVSEDRQLAGCGLELYINSQWRDAQVLPSTLSLLVCTADCS
jgi:hypothetical protein